MDGSASAASAVIRALMVAAVILESGPSLALMQEAPEPSTQPERPCAQAVQALVARMSGSAYAELQVQVDAHQSTQTLLDAIREPLELGPSWKEGNPHWEEAYALYHPGYLALTRSVHALVFRELEEALPPRLGLGACQEFLAVRASRFGPAIERISFAREVRTRIAKEEAKLPKRPPIQEWLEKTRLEVKEALALLEDFEVLQAGPAFQAAQDRARALDRPFTEALEQTGRSLGPETERALVEAGGELAERHLPAIREIVRRFRDST